jgi:hypothetical protein
MMMILVGKILITLNQLNLITSERSDTQQFARYIFYFICCVLAC